MILGKVVMGITCGILPHDPFHELEYLKRQPFDLFLFIIQILKCITNALPYCSFISLFIKLDLDRD